MTFWIEFTAQLATILAGAAAAVAILIGVSDRRRDQYGKDMGEAALVTAWRAFAVKPGSVDRILGVVIENASREVAIQVDVKPGVLNQKQQNNDKSTQGSDAEQFERTPDAEIPGLRLAVLPSGSWFVPLSDDPDEKTPWKAQIEIEDGSGARHVLIADDELPGSTRSRYQLFPEARIDDGAPAVHFMRFKLNSKTWWRNELGQLFEDAKGIGKRSMRRLAPDDWNTEFAESAVTKRNEVTAKADFSKYTWKDGTKKNGKFETINLIAQHWADKHQVTSREEFEKEFGKELQAAVPQHANRHDISNMLTENPATVRNDGNPKELYLTLDGKLYGIKWVCGFKSAPKIGLEIHKPIVEHFMKKHGVPAKPVS